MTAFILLSIILLMFIIFILIITNPILSSTKDNASIPVQKERLYNDVKVLTEITPARNSRNIASLNKAADYIYDEFAKLDTQPSRQKYQADGQEYQNVLCSFGPEAGPRIIVGAHYDVCGDQPGADDNASAVAGLLEMARLVSELKPDLKYRVDFVAYSLEEPPYFRTQYMGSAIHAESLVKNNIDVKLMICLEMIGYFSEEEGSQEYPISFLKLLYPKKGNFIAVIGKLGQGSAVRKIKRYMKKTAAIDVRSINAPKALPGIDFSDHQNYWKHGWDAVMINNTSFYRNKNYHEVTDDIHSLDFDKMTEVVRGAYWALVNY